MSDKEKIEGKENSDRKKGADLRRARELMGLTSIRPLIEYFELGPIIKYGGERVESLCDGFEIGKIYAAPREGAALRNMKGEPVEPQYEDDAAYVLCDISDAFFYFRFTPDCERTAFTAFDLYTALHG